MLFFILVILINFAKSNTSSNSEQATYDDQSEELSYLPKIKTTIDTRGYIRQYFGVDYALGREQLNMVASPLAAMLPLGKLLLGVKKYSEFEDNLLHAVGLKTRNEVKDSFKDMVNILKSFKGGNLSLTSRIYVKRRKKEVDKIFKAKSQSLFKSSVQLLDLQNAQEAADILSSWAYEHTDKKINDAVQKSDLESSNAQSLILISAIYFRGIWKKEFQKDEMQFFFAESGKTISTSMMVTCGSFNYVTSEELSAQIIEIPYNDENSAMIVLLPNTKNGLPFILRTLRASPDMLNAALKNMKKTSMKLTLPKFGILATVDTNKYYKKAGLKNLQIPYIIREETLFISRGKQKMYVKVDNPVVVEGAKKNQLPIEVKRNYLTTVNVTVNHPFMFYIRINYDQLFTGAVYEP